MVKLSKAATDLTHLETLHEEEGGTGLDISESIEGGEYDIDKEDSSSNTPNSSTAEKSKSLSDEEKLELAKGESILVFRLRLLTFVILLAAACAVSVTIYYITSKTERQEFESQYEASAAKVIQAFEDIITKRLAAISSMGVAMAGQGVDNQGSEQNLTWPFVTLTHFTERAASVRAQSQALALQVNPMIQLHQREQWEAFVKTNVSYAWIDEATSFQERVGLFDFNPGLYGDRLARDGEWPIWYYNEQRITTDATSGPFMPTWQSSPLFDYGNRVNQNLLHPTDYSRQGLQRSYSNASVLIGEFVTATPGDMFSWDLTSAKFALMQSTYQGKMVNYQGDPISQVYFPVFDSFRADRKPAAVLLAWIHWRAFFQDVLPSSLKGIYFVLQNTCGQTQNYTYVINKNGDHEGVFPLGPGDLHQRQHSKNQRSSSFDQFHTIDDGTEFGLNLDPSCRYTITVYPSDEFVSDFKTSLPIIMTLAVAIVFFFAVFVFAFYDKIVEKRQRMVLSKALQSTAIVASMFPENVQKRLMEVEAQKAADQNHKQAFTSQKRRSLKGYLNSGANDGGTATSTPIADLFPFCTVLFADIAGFTAWSSARDPGHVFILLQNVYQAFDLVAKRRKVFKVETIGDSYVAVTGLPEQQPTHAVIMTRFASDCRRRFFELTAKLEATLGPDTSDLGMRFGLHSGPVTGGVLMGDRPRFQLFGDTVNTAARMESTGVVNKIQISKSTYEALCEMGKSDWAHLRSDKVQAKGKGALQTYFVEVGRGHSASGGSTTTSSSRASENPAAAHQNSVSFIASSPKPTVPTRYKKQERLVCWITDMLLAKVHKMKAMQPELNHSKKQKASFAPLPGQIAIDEIKEVIQLPKFCITNDANQATKEVAIGADVQKQLHDLVSAIASRYHENPFHCFEHACHVTMAVDKFLKRIVDADIGEEEGDVEARLHDYTHGINSDPLTHLAIVFSALIHDVDHRGVSNLQLIKEQEELGQKYRNKSVAEQNSLDIAWDLLMQDEFTALRDCLFTTEEELLRFRQIIVNVVLATDIFDPELSALRKTRWKRAFGDKKDGTGDLVALEKDSDDNDRRATIVIEHIIQAADVSHTMQHWTVYRKWNKKLFQEMHQAFRQGRMGKNPADFWYKGELGFFDNYVIPLAEKLKDCQVFGVSSDECLDYAKNNRDEWNDKGEELVAAMVQELEPKRRRSSSERVGKNDDSEPAKAVELAAQQLPGFVKGVTVNSEPVKAVSSVAC